MKQQAKSVKDYQKFLKLTPAACCQVRPQQIYEGVTAWLNKF